jgi:hypothetical protein
MLRRTADTMMTHVVMLVYCHVGVLSCWCIVVLVYCHVDVLSCLCIFVLVNCRVGVATEAMATATRVVDK